MVMKEIRSYNLRVLLKTLDSVKITRPSQERKLFFFLTKINTMILGPSCLLTAQY